VQLDAVEARLFGAQSGFGEQTRQHLRQALDVRAVQIGDALAIAELQRFPFVRRQHAGEFVLFHGAQAGAHLGVGQARLTKRSTMPIGDGEEALEEFFRFGTAANGEKVD
jgi:hypothetical protein